MSYGRDRDAATRAPGAIASRDLAHPRAAHARARANARATLRRDRATRGATFGSNGGLAGGLGAISTAVSPTGLTGGVRRPVLVEGGVIEGAGPRPTYTPPGTKPPPRSIVKGVRTIADPIRAAVFGVRSTAPAPKATRAALDIITNDPKRQPGSTAPSDGKTGSRDQTPVVTTPVEPTAPSPTKTTTNKGLVSSGGGGGGGGWSPPKSTPSSALPAPSSVDIPEMPEPEAAPATKPASGINKLLLIGAAIGGVYLLLREDG